MATNRKEEEEGKVDEFLRPLSVLMSEMVQNDNDNIYQDDIDPLLKCTSVNTFSDDDNNNEQDKTLMNQASQVDLVNPKPSKRIKTPKRPRKIKSAAKQSSEKIPMSSLQTDVNSTKLSKLTITTTKNEDNNNNIGKHQITVDTSKARSNLDVVRMCIKELGWKECTFSTMPDSDIYWHSSSFHEGNTNFTVNSGRINKFPSMNDLLRKVHLTRSLNNMRLLFPNEFDFYPKTWFLPEQNQQFKDDVRYIHQQDKKHERSLTTFIVKPSDGSQGEGIYLVRDPAHYVVTNRPHVIQEYIDRPLLINGLKFDLRIYVLILNIYPLEIYLYDEVLVSFATINYNPPSTENLHQTYMHLTNYSLNKRSSNYKHAFDSKQTDGSKRTLSTVWAQLIHMFGDDKIEKTKVLITEMINKTILAILPELRVEYEFELPSAKKSNVSCFQIVGFDIILTDDLKPMLLEVNANPSLRIDFDKENDTGKLVYQSSPIDEEIKKPLILETLKLALPKKKLNTLARHNQKEANDELLLQRLEKVAQRRIDERYERIKSARKHFDLKSNPLFSRPPERKKKESEDLQQEQIKPSTNPLIRKTKNISDTEEDDDEIGPPIVLLPETNSIHPYRISSAMSRRPIIKSATSRYQSTIRIESDKKLKLIFSSIQKTKYQHLILLDKIAYIYIQFVTILGHKTMTSLQFRSFINICGINNETITTSSIDILYYQILRKWQQFVLRTPSTGLPFSAFIEAFFLLSQRKFPDATSLLDSVTQLLTICVRNINLSLQNSSSSVPQQSNQYHSSHLTRVNSSINSSSSSNNHPSILSARSTNRPTTAPPSAHRTITTTATKPDDKTKQLVKSVFPLFFNVL
ncbi:unnamed protein product [Adineta steineri]|uniref:Uncharacterized protein n=2 Tax=Adineta steineri TaxID=433720 RepID=A0A814JJC0_9BILA|nr:unnamed protein product [Adineta steineri]